MFRRRKDSDFQAEIEAHIQLEADRLVAEGMSAGDARQAARRAFGNPTSSAERFHESSRWMWIEQFAQDLRYASRILRRSPAFTVVALASLAIGIGANTAVFSLLDGLLLKPVPVRNPAELRQIAYVRSDSDPIHSHSGYGVTDKAGRTISGSFSFPIYLALRDQAPAFSAVVGFARNQFTVAADGVSDYANGQYVSGNYFDGLGVSTIIGRPLLGEDDAPGKSRVAVITYSFWERRFGLDPNVVGRRIVLNRTPVTIIGVTRPGFNGLYPGRLQDLFVPMALIAEDGPGWYSLTQPDTWWVHVFARIRPGVPDQKAAESARAVVAHQVESYSASWTPKVTAPELLIYPGGRGVELLRDEFSSPMLILSAVVGLVMLIACANLANLLLARAAGRSRELAVRLSIGAGRGRLIRQLLTEALLLAGCGGALGVLLAAPIREVILDLVSGSQPLGFEARTDLRTLLFTLTLTFVTALLFGAAPALRASRQGHSRATSFTGGMRPSRLLISGQIALSLLLLVGAALFLRTLANLRSVDLGFRPDNVLTFQTDASRNGYKGQAIAELYTRLRARLEAIPGVEEVSMSHHGLIQGATTSDRLKLPGIADKPGAFQPVYILYCSDNFIHTMRMRLELGRPLSPADKPGAPLAAVVNETFARKYYAGRNPVGLTFSRGDRESDPIEIIGVIKGAR
jgi:predicted permease